MLQHIDTFNKIGFAWISALWLPYDAAERWTRLYAPLLIDYYHLSGRQTNIVYWNMHHGEAVICGIFCLFCSVRQRGNLDLFFEVIVEKFSGRASSYIKLLSCYMLL